MKVRQERGGSIFIFYDFLTHKNAFSTNFAKTKLKKQGQLKAGDQLFISLTRCMIPLCCIMCLLQRSPGTCEIMRLAADGINYYLLIFNVFRFICSYLTDPQDFVTLYFEQFQIQIYWNILISISQRTISGMTQKGLVYVNILIGFVKLPNLNQKIS